MADFAEEFLQQAKQNIDSSFQALTVLPGDDVTEEVTRLKKSIKIGTGLQQDGDHVAVTTGGCLRYRAPATYYVESNLKRYIPNVGDHVVAMIEEKTGDYYRVNLLSGSMAVLHQLAFEGATKRNKPELGKGDIIYARVLTAYKDVDAELVCTASSGVNKEWTTGESVSKLRPQICLL
jgi:exosome complex component RRP40